MWQGFQKWATHEDRRLQVQHDDPKDGTEARERYEKEEKIIDLEQKLHIEGDETDEDQLLSATTLNQHELEKVFENIDAVNEWLQFKKHDAAIREQTAVIYGHVSDRAKIYRGYSTRGKVITPLSEQALALFEDRDYDIDNEIWDYKIKKQLATTDGQSETAESV